MEREYAFSNENYDLIDYNSENNNSENNNSTIPDTNSFLSKLKQKSLQSQINSNSISHNTNDIIQLKDEIQLLKSGQDKIISLLHTLLHSNITTDLEK